MSVFKAYDIRGVYGKELDEKVAYKVGRSFVSHFGMKKLAVGRDMRKSGMSLFKELARGITDQGADVVDIGLVATPVLGTTVAREKLDGGIMISASHNPGEYNAFKLVKYPCEQLSPESGMEDIRLLCEKGNWTNTAVKGKIISFDALPPYISNVLQHAEGIKGLKVVVDYGNGIGSVIGNPVFRKLDIKYLPMYEEPDGTFPNHPANPHDYENLRDLQDRVKREKADIGIFFDGDADRSYMVDEKGDIVPADMLVGLFAQEELKKYPGERVYFDLRFSKAVRDAIKAAGGEPVMMKVGNPFYKAALIHQGGILGGEFSGHIMFKDNFFQDDGLFAAVKILSILSRTRKPLSSLIQQFRTYHQTPEINMKVKDAKATLQMLKDSYSDGKFIGIDGVLIEYPDWWFSIRMSNTEPLVRLRIEADTAGLLEEKKKEILDKINSMV